jgi:hypothetical protein
MGDFVKRGQKHRLNRDDLYNVPKSQESKIVGQKFMDIWNHEKAFEDIRTQWGLHKTIFIFSKRPIILSGILEFVKIIFGLLSPFILQSFLKAYKNSDSDIYYMLMYCFAMCFTQLMSAVAGNWSIWVLVKSGLNVRTGLMSAIYHRSLNLSGIEKKNYSIGLLQV